MTFPSSSWTQESVWLSDYIRANGSTRFSSAYRSEGQLNSIVRPHKRMDNSALELTFIYNHYVQKDTPPPQASGTGHICGVVVNGVL